MFYVYELTDPRTGMPFYVGKGTGARAKTHFWEIPATRNIHKENKINAIRQAGLEPTIRYVVENIEDEDIAYAIEEALIQKYGRKGYEQDGILTNICINSRPPNHKGKSYEEIYGSAERANEQRSLRARLQKERGGYGPRTHSLETRKKLSERANGRKYGPYSEERKSKIGKANSKYRGETNKKSYKWVLTDPNGVTHTTIGNLNEFCKSLGLSPATIHKMLYSHGYMPKSGPAVGWKIESEQHVRNPSHDQRSN